MPSYDLILVHAPSVYDFRERSLLFGPVSDMIPSTPVFEMYPIGFTTMASLLHKRGYRVRILNLAAHMLADEKFDVEKAIGKLRSRVFGIDLHWLPHAHGSLEVAKIIKRIHPDSRVIMGGFSATYFREELMCDHPYVDEILIGDSTELPLLRYFEALEKGRSLERVPNLVYREGGRIRDNGITHIIDSLDKVEIDYRWVIGSVMRTLDLTGHLPYLDWKNNPMFMVNTVRGCSLDCLTCMGGSCSFKRNFGRTRPAFRSAKKLIEDIDQIESYFKGTVFVIGDIRQSGNANAAKFLKLLRKAQPRNELAFEFFTPPGEKFVRAMSRSMDRFNAQISPDSADPKVREAIGRYYSNEQLERSVVALLKAGVGRMDIFYMIGLPYQDVDSVLSTVKYSEGLMKRLGAKERLMPFISPLGPFLDPGGEAFENPEKHGYTILAKTLAQHRDLLTRPSWKMVLNYSTEWLSPEQMVDATYEGGLGMNRAKRRVGAISDEAADAVAGRIALAREAMARIDEIVKLPDPEPALAAYREELRVLSESTVCNKRELDWSRKSFYWSIPRTALSVLLRR